MLDCHLTCADPQAPLAGNLVVVVPASLAAQPLWLAAGGASVPDAAKARTAVASRAIAGPTPLYAACTGVLLWFPAVPSGWVGNGVTYRRLLPPRGRHTQ